MAVNIKGPIVFSRRVLWATGSVTVEVPSGQTVGTVAVCIPNVATEEGARFTLGFGSDPGAIDGPGTLVGAGHSYLATGTEWTIVEAPGVTHIAIEGFDASTGVWIMGW